MATSRNELAPEAKIGQRMVEVKIRFWTDEIAGPKEQIIPKHAWAAGAVRMERNEVGIPNPSTLCSI